MKDVPSLIHNSGELENRQEVVVFRVFKVFLAPQISLGGLHEPAQMDVELGPVYMEVGDPR